MSIQYHVEFNGVSEYAGVVSIKWRGEMEVNGGKGVTHLSSFGLPGEVEPSLFIASLGEYPTLQ